MSLTSSDPFRRAFELRSLLNKAGHAYYVLDSPFLEDTVYDAFYRELISLEKQYPELITHDSPSKRLGGLPATGFSSSKHRIPLFSLDNAFNIKELEAWYSKVQRNLGEKPIDNNFQTDIKMIGELKIDGNALALSYSKGILIKAATRGNGSEGEEITANARTICSLPLCLQLEDPPPWLEVRGEAFIPNDEFTKTNQTRQSQGEHLFANPRNACAGTLRQLDSRVVASRHLDFFAYSLHLPDDWDHKVKDYKKPKTQWDALRWLQRAGFKVNPHNKLLENLHEAKDFFSDWETDRQTLPYATDGVVLKVNTFELQTKVGFTQKAPRWAIALKYPAEEAPSKLIKLTYQIGRTGAVTPVAEFESIALAGTRVTRASLHNADRLKSLDLHSGDTVVIRKAGEIIPEVVRVIKELRPQEAVPLSLPANCPECQSTLVKANNEAITRCLNSSCPAILRGALRHWVNKASLNIEGIGNKLIHQLVEQKLVQSIANLYELNLHNIVKLERMGPKSASKLMTSISESKNQPWHKKLYGLGINHIGETNAKVLTKNFHTIEELLDSAVNSPELITSIFGIGDEIAQALIEWSSNSNNQKLIADLKRVGVNLSASEKEIELYSIQKNQISNLLEGQTFVLTGSMNSLSRNEAKTLIEEKGGKVTSSISANTSYLIAGSKAGSKLNRANALGIKVLNEDEFKNLLFP